MNKCPYYTIFKRKTWCDKYKTDKVNCAECMRFHGGRYPEVPKEMSLEGLTIDIIDRKGNVLAIIQEGILEGENL